MFKFHFKSLLCPIGLLAAAAVVPQLARPADNCDNVKITISNQTGDEVKVKKLEYHAFSDGWRTETGIFGVDGFQKLEPGQALAWTRDLHDVENKNTFFRVTYAHHIGGSKWDPDKTETTEKFECNNGDKTEITLTK